MLKRSFINLLLFVVAVYAGYLLVLGNNRDVGIILSIILFLIVLLWAHNKSRLRHMLLLAVILSWFNYPIGFSIIPLTVIEIILSVILVLLVLRQALHYHNFRIHREDIKLIGFPFIIFVGGLINNRVNHGSLFDIIEPCLVPLMVVYSCTILLDKIEDSRMAIIAALGSSLLFCIFSDFAIRMGWSSEYLQHMQSGRMAAEISFGWMTYALWGNWLGATAVMAMPSAIVLMLTAPNFSRKVLFFIAALFLLYYGLRAATMGAMIGIGFSIVSVLILSYANATTRQKLNYQILGNIFFVIIVFGIISFMKSEAILSKIEEYQKLGIDVPNVQFRLNLLLEAYGSLLRNPAGIGLGKNWLKFGIDECNYFVVLANGMGAMGVIGFIGASLLFASRFFKTLLNSKELPRVVFAVIGLSTMISTFVGAQSSDQILLLVQTNVPFWVIMTSAYKGCIPSIATLERK
jgi:hypothetical protein